MAPLNFIVSPRRRFIRGSLIILGCGILVYGFFRSFDTSTSQHTLWVIDNSLSMMVADIGTQSGVMISRLALAKDIIQTESVRIGGDQAIMTAANGARLEIPLTSDLTAIANVAQGINPISHGGGSSFVTPLETMRLIYGNMSHLHIIWITDGEFTDSGTTMTGFQGDTTLTFIGVGTRLGGPILLGYDSDGRPKYKESEGARVNSIRNDSILTSISGQLGAHFLPLENNTLTDLEASEQMSPAPIQEISWMMVVGVICLIVGLMYPRYQYFPFSHHGK